MQFYLSDIIGKKIIAPNGSCIGRVRDLVIRWPQMMYPQVVGIKCTISSQVIPLGYIGEFTPQGIFLNKQWNENVFRPAAEEEIFVRRWILDKQIVDINGAKVVRVNDILLRTEKENEAFQMYLVAVDIGFRGLVRRLGFKCFSMKFREHLLEWQHFKPLEARTANLQLIVPREALSQLHPADIAAILEKLGRYEQVGLLRHLDRKLAARTLAEVSPQVRAYLLEILNTSELIGLLRLLAPDDVADIISNLADERRNELFELMRPEEAQEIQKLMKYPDGTIGSLMTTDVLTLPACFTAQQAIDYLRQEAPLVEAIYHLYVVDEENHLVGVLSLQELIIIPPDTLLGHVVQRNVATVRPEDSLTMAVEAMAKYNLFALPVVDEERKVIGTVTVDDVLGNLLVTHKGKPFLHEFLHQAVIWALRKR